jgi:glycosyltransferase involved in cell wall biosynthesis
MKLDVIIPAYNAHGTIDRCLAGIACQTIVDDVRVTIVDDCSKNGYARSAGIFSKLMDIQVIRTDVNGGPGAARQFGLEHTDNPLITFIDADDTFAGAFALKKLEDAFLTDETVHTCVGNFEEELPDGRLVLHDQNMVWIAGKMYRRAFIDKYDIRFLTSSRADEDYGFNTIIRLLSSENEKISYFPETVYFWHYTENSITRKNNYQYNYDQNFTGWRRICHTRYGNALTKKPSESAIRIWAAQIMCQLMFISWRRWSARRGLQSKILRRAKDFTPRPSGR